MTALLRAHVASLKLSAAYIGEQRGLGRRVVLAVGSFLVVDRAGVEYLRAAAALGDRLAVLVQAPDLADAVERAEVVAGLRSVDLVVPIGPPGTFDGCLRVLRPSSLAIADATLRERATCDALGIEVHTRVGARKAA